MPNWTRIAPCAGNRKGKAGVWLTLGAKAVSMLTNSLDPVRQEQSNFLEVSIDPELRLVRLTASQNPDDFAWPVAKALSHRNLWVALRELGCESGRYPGRIEDGAVIFDCSTAPQPLPAHIDREAEVIR